MALDLSGIMANARVAGSSSVLDGLRKKRAEDMAQSRARMTQIMDAVASLGGGGSAPAGGGARPSSSRGGGALSTPTSGGGHGGGLVTIRTPNGGSVTVAKAYASRFTGLMNDLYKAGYHFKSVGGYNYRNIAGTNKLSKHATGEAIDIDPGPNRGTRLGGGGNPYGYFNPNVAVAIARKWGLDWGGTWKGQEDPMHFSTGG